MNNNVYGAVSEMKTFNFHTGKLMYNADGWRSLAYVFIGWKCINCSIIIFSDENLFNKVACDVFVCYDLRALSCEELEPNNNA